jgi:hypothetical protein
MQTPSVYRRPTLVVLLAAGFPDYEGAVRTAQLAGESIKLCAMRADKLAAFGFAPSSAGLGLLMRDRAGFWHVGDAAWHCLLAMCAPLRRTAPVQAKSEPLENATTGLKLAPTLRNASRMSRSRVA